MSPAVVHRITAVCIVARYSTNRGGAARRGVAWSCWTEARMQDSRHCPSVIWRLKGTSCVRSRVEDGNVPVRICEAIQRLRSKVDDLISGDIFRCLSDNLIRQISDSTLIVIKWLKRPHRLTANQDEDSSFQDSCKRIYTNKQHYLNDGSILLCFLQQHLQTIVKQVTA